MKQFLVILGLTALVWLAVSMAEEHEYPMKVRVEMTGYDTVRYAVVHADTVLPIQASMEGINAAAVSLFGITPRVTFEMPGDGLRRTLPVAEVADNLRQQLASLGVRHVVGSRDSLLLVLAERESRTFRVSLDSVDFLFAEQYGLYGEPRVTPAMVTLFGPARELDAIGELQVARNTFSNISSTGTYRLPLDPVWQRMNDVRTTATEVEVYLPVEAYVEREFKAPIEVDGADTTMRLRLYPDEAKIRVWVAKRDLERQPDFRVAINYSDVLAGNGRLEPRLVSFPSWVRPRSVEPSEVQCVVIR